MRQIFSVRFFAAVGGVVVLFFLLTTIFATRGVIEGDDGDEPIELHRIDFVDRVSSSSDGAFRFDDEGLAAIDTDLIIDGSRSVRVVTGTPGVDLCPEFPAVDACAVLADLLGEAVVWLALVPAGLDGEVDLPAVDTLENGIATLVNGWQLPFAPVLDRRCRNEDFASFREFRDVLGDDFTTVFGIEDRRLIAVACRTRVPYAPEIERDPGG